MRKWVFTTCKVVYHLCQNPSSRDNSGIYLVLDDTGTRYLLNPMITSSK